jgi:ABC-type multidrug transport system fused ATPase/permease subunit
VFVLCLYAASEGAYTGFYYIFGSYDNVDNRWDLFWQAGVLLACFILICLTKYLGTVLIANNANKNMHKKMFNSIARSPVLYFD